MPYVADTHALIWFLTNDEQLGSKAREIFEITEKGEEIIIISAISLLEIMYLCEKKGIANQYKKILEQLKTSLNYLVFDVNVEITEKCVELTKVSEMHDRIIVATANITNAGIVTKDQNIIAAKYVNIIW